MKKISLWVGVILLQCLFSLATIAKEQEQTIIIEEPTNHELILNKAEVGPNVIQLWHYSGGAVGINFLL